MAGGEISGEGAKVNEPVEENTGTMKRKERSQREQYIMAQG